MILQTNSSQKKAGVAILISDKIDFKPKKVTIDKDRHYIMKKGTIYQENVGFITIYAPNIGASRYIKQLLTVLKETLAATK